MTKLSEIAWEQSKKVYLNTINHPFNQQLMKGTLSIEKFGYYIEQDFIYLKAYAKALAMIAARSQCNEHIKQFLDFASGAITERESLHKFLQDKLELKEIGNTTLATLAYTSYLSSVTATEPFEVAVAAVLPCFWVYREIGIHIAKNSVPNNIFVDWIKEYSSESFSIAVNKAIDIFDYLAEHTTEEIKQQMCDTFYKSTVLEWHFWHDAYKINVFDDVSDIFSSELGNFTALEDSYHIETQGECTQHIPELN